LNNLAYTQTEQVVIVNDRNEAAAQKILEIKNNTQAAIAKLVSLKILLIDLKKEVPLCF
jgi:hypothetical protein